MKRLLFILSVCFLIFSCSDDDDVVVYPNYVSAGTVVRSTDSLVVQSDNGKILVPYNYQALYPFANGQRLYLNYSVLRNQYEGYSSKQLVEINDYIRILTKNMVALTSNNVDSIGNDPFLGIQNMWVGADYLNIIFTFGAYNRSHMLNLVENYLDYDDPLEGDTVYLSFRQNSFKDPSVYTYQGIVSFDLTPLIKPERSSVVLAVEVLFAKNKTRTYYRTFRWEKEDEADVIVLDMDIKPDVSFYE